jgi:hypothetical protein
MIFADALIKLMNAFPVSILLEQCDKLNRYVWPSGSRSALERCCHRVAPAVAGGCGCDGPDAGIPDCLVADGRCITVVTRRSRVLRRHLWPSL